MSDTSARWRERLAPFAALVISLVAMVALAADLAASRAVAGGEPTLHLGLLGVGGFVCVPLGLLAGVASTVLTRRSDRGRGLVVAAQVLHVLATLAAGVLLLGALGLLVL